MLSLERDGLGSKKLQSCLRKLKNLLFTPRRTDSDSCTATVVHSPKKSIFLLCSSLRLSITSAGTLQLKAQPTNAFFATVNHFSLPAVSPGFRHLPSTFFFSLSELCSTISSAEHLIEGSKKHICRLSPHVIERRSNVTTDESIFSKSTNEVYYIVFAMIPPVIWRDILSKFIIFRFGK